MPIHNQDIARSLNQLSDLLEIDGADPFRVRAYRNAAHVVEDMSENISGMVEEGKDLSKLPDIGKSMSDKLVEFVKKGKLKQLDDMKKKVPVDTDELMQIQQLGAKRIGILYKKLKITNIKKLKKAAEDNKISKLEGFGKKTQEKILDEIERFLESGGEKRFKWAVASDIVTSYLEYIEKYKGIKKLIPAGSYRRKKETVGDVDILVVCDDNKKIMDHFVQYDEVDDIIAQGKSKTTVLLKSGIRVDLRAVPDKGYGAALLYFTGSKEHNVALRKMGQKKDWKINEYGIFKQDKQIAGKTEKEMYKKLGLNYIEPELRENRGEIEASKKNKLPKLITLEDIKGDLHTHTNATDGKYSLKDMVNAAREKKYQYYSISDHSKRVTMAHGLNEKRLEQQIEEIDKLNEEFKDIRILKSIEVDILEDGHLDLDDSVLEQLDLVVCSVHYNTNLSRNKQTKRVLHAMENPHFNIFAHPSGRLIGERHPYDIDMEKIIKEAKNNGCYLEINADPRRLDLSDVNAKMAKDHGVKIAISTDAHSISNLDNIRFGVFQARRAWLEKNDVLNTHTWKQLKKLLKR